MDQSSQEGAHQAYNQQVSGHCIQMGVKFLAFKGNREKNRRFNFAAIDDANRVDAR